MEEDFDATNVLVSDSFKEASEEVCKRFPRYNSRVIYKGTPIEKHFYVDGNDVSEDEYNDVVKLSDSSREARRIALDEAKLEILRNMESVDDSASEETTCHDPIPEDPNLTSEVSRYLKDIRDSNEKRIEYSDYIIKILKSGPKTYREIEKRICRSHKVCGNSADSLLDKLEYYGVVYKRPETESRGLMRRLVSFVYKRHEPEQVKFMYRLTPFWEIMYPAMKNNFLYLITNVSFKYFHE